MAVPEILRRSIAHEWTVKETPHTASVPTEMVFVRGNMVPQQRPGLGFPGCQFLRK